MSGDGPSGAEFDLLPPQRMIDFVGEGDFKVVGETFLTYLKNLAGLKPHEAILDLGCGCGRMAIPLTRYLNAEGAYRGCDIYKEGVEWCTQHIASKFPNFRFECVDIYNKRYNPDGKESASVFRFPY
ncbi:MAG: class I SAM-dependent methyltransferase, partial [Deltaproteobacteria bacterium]|nr:class I SAM-dependent methyltransferase [Deltaproteobacteria bacterium]